LIAATIAAFAAYITIAQMKAQLETEQKRQQEERISQLAVFKQAIRLYIQKTQAAAKNGVMSTEHGYDSNNSITLDKKIWADILEAPPAIIQDYQFIARIPAKDIAHCLNLAHEVAIFHKLVLETPLEHIEQGDYLYCSRKALDKFQGLIHIGTTGLTAKLNLIQ
jgi:hypothetical protein